MNFPVVDRRIFRWDSENEPNEADLEFFLTYEGELRAHRPNQALRNRTHHLHSIRRHFHKQIGALVDKHPFVAGAAKDGVHPDVAVGRYEREGFSFRALVTERNNLLCKLDIVMLRNARKAHPHADMDNRIKTLFDALRLPKDAQELGSASSEGQVKPANDETPFYVLLEDDGLITHLRVGTGILLDPVPDVSEDDAVRLMIGVTIRPYAANSYNHKWL